MGNFLAVTAFRDATAQDVARAISEYMTLHAVSCDPVPAGTQAPGPTDAQLFAPVNGWTVVLWPTYFNVHDFALARHVAGSTGWLVSSMHVYDDDYWEHLAVRGAEELHLFCSRPHYWQEDPAEQERVAAYRTAPNAIAAATGVSVAALEPYLVDVDELEDDSERAHDDDEFELGDTWVFTDFWRRLGIAYPDPPVGAVATLRLPKAFGEKLPAG